MDNKKHIQSNIWKYFIFALTQRRHFIPILSIYFLTLPNTTAQQIGLYSAIGFIFSFFLEIPSGYFADRFGHKKTLILSKILMMLALIVFIVANSFIVFSIGSILLSLGFAFYSGTSSAFMHNTLEVLGRDKDYVRIMSKIGANVSMLSAILIMSLPFLTDISIILPLKVNLGIDFIGLIISFMLVSPKRKRGVGKSNWKKIIELLKKSKNTGFYPFTIFIALLSGSLLGTSAFYAPYIQSLGLPLVLIGFIMGLSRIVWFIVGHYAHKIEKIGIKKIFLAEIIIFPGLFIFASLFSNPYLVGAGFVLVIGYHWGRNQIIQEFLLSNFVVDKNYKATMISIHQQFKLIVQIIVAVGIGFLFNLEFKLGYFVLGISLLIALIIAYPFAARAINLHKN